METGTPVTGRGLEILRREERLELLELVGGGTRTMTHGARALRGIKYERKGQERTWAIMSISSNLWRVS